MDELYLCRHAGTEWTSSGQHTSQTDLSLSEEGKHQASLLRKRLEKIDFDQVFCSPMKRAKETAQGMKAVVEPLLVEWNYGDYEGLTTAEIHEQSPKWNLFKNGAPHGESLQQVALRADQFLKKISLYKGKVAVISHGHFLRVLAMRFLGLKAEMGSHLFLSVASMSILGYEHGEAVINLWNCPNGQKG
jgi:probable phosphoglycerate mutase